MDSYYDLDAILAGAHKVPCTFQMDVPGLGFVDGNSSHNIKGGAEVALPLWLAGIITVQSFNVVKMDLPTSISPRVLNALKANPKTVDLSSQAPHFYEVAARALEFFEEDEIVDILTETFKTRAAEIADRSHNSRGVLGESGESPKGLDEMEKQLFRGAHESSKATQAWLGELRRKA